MALIKKYDAGGKAGFRDYIVKKLFTEDGLNTKAQELINQELSGFDPTSELEDTEFSGSIKDNASAKSWLNKNYKEFSKPGLEVDIKPEEGWGPRERKVGTLMNYISRTNFGNNEESALRSLSEMTDNKKIKQYVVKNAKALTNEYLGSMEKESLEAPENKWHNKEELAAARDVLNNIDENGEISDDDWNKVVDFTNKLDWQLPRFLRTKEELAGIESDKTIADEKVRFDSSVSNFKGIGLDEETSKLYAQNKYTINNDYEPFEDMPFLKNALAGKGVSIIQSPDKKGHMLMKDGKAVTDLGGTITMDQFNKHYGKTWGTDANGTLTFFEKGQHSANENLKLPDSEYNSNIGRGLDTFDPKYSSTSGYTLTGYSGDNYDGTEARDQYGYRDYTKQIHVKGPDGEFTATKDDETGKYFRDDDGEEFDIKLSGYNNTITPEKVDYVKKYIDNSISLLHGMKKGKFNSSMHTANAQLDKIEAKIKEATKAGKKINIKKGDLNKIYESLYATFTYKGKGTNTPEWDKSLKEAEALMLRLTKLSNTKLADGTTLRDDPVFKYAEGGIIIAQKGTSTDEFVRASLANPNVKTNQTEARQNPAASTGMRDITGTVQDANALDWISTGASVASFIPGVGIIGGLVSTGADALNALNRGWQGSDWTNLASNVGFTALAGIGLGSVKGLKMAGKASKLGKIFTKGAKTLDAAEDVAKGIGSFSKVAKVGNKAARMGDLGADAVQASKKLGMFAEEAKKASGGTKAFGEFLKNGTMTDDILKAAQNAGYAVDDLAGAVKSDLGIIDKISKVKTNWFSAVGSNIYNSTKEAVKKLPDVAQKTGKWVLPGTQLYGGAVGAVHVGQNIAEEGHVGRGLQVTKMKDISNILRAGATGRGMFKNYQGSQDIKKNFEKVYAKAATGELKVGDGKGIAVNTKIKVPEAKSTWFKKGDAKYSEKDLATFKTDLTKAGLPEDQVAAIIKQAQEGATIAHTFTPGEGMSYVRNAAPRSSSDSDIRSYMRTDHLPHGGTNYFSSRRWNAKVGQPAKGNTITVTNSGGTSKVTETKIAPKVTPKVEAKVEAKVTPTNTAKSTKPAKEVIAKVKGPRKMRVSEKAKPTKDEKATIVSKMEKDLKRAENKFAKTKDPIIQKQIDVFNRRLRGMTSGRKGTKKMHAGGIIKFAVGGNLYQPIKLELPKLNASLAYKSKFGNTPSITQTSSTFNNYITTPARTRILGSIKPDNNAATSKEFITNYRIPTSATSTPTTTTPKSESLFTEEYEWQPWEKGKYSNTKPVFEAMALGITNQHNARATRSYQQAASEVPKLSTMSSSHLRTGTPYSAISEGQAGIMRSAGNRASNSTSDIALGINARLQSEKDANNIVFQGKLQDIQRNDQIRGQQQQMDERVNSYNLGVLDKQSALGSQARAQVHQLSGAETLRRGENFSQFTKYLGHEASLDPYKRQLWDYQQEFTNPNIAGVQEHITSLSSDKRNADLKKVYDNWIANDPQGKAFAINGKFEDSDIYKKNQSMIEKYNNIMTSLNNKFSRSKSTLDAYQGLLGGGK